MTFGQEIVVLCLESFRCMLGGSVEVWTKNSLFWFIEGQIMLGRQRGSKMSLALNELNQVALHSHLNTTSEHASQVEEKKRN